MNSTSSHISAFMFFLLFTTLNCMSTTCNKKDLENLLLFRKGVVDIEGAPSSWKMEEDSDKPLEVKEI
ncbi:transmembrane protein, putative [Medicago truncatula]|uniref:Transmembrane protein, putative n=1 Tax=Medicago truncatula TaxID=3880 RepID=G7J1Y9_MEDTR|nr:transmembrane protein, putative [Medicago truncatula]